MEGSAHAYAPSIQGPIQIPQPILSPRVPAFARSKHSTRPAHGKGGDALRRSDCGMGSLATTFKHGTAWASIHGCTMVPHAVGGTSMRCCSSGKKMQLMAIIARRWPLCDYISLQQGCGSVAAKGNARNHRVSGVRARGVSTSPIVHIVHTRRVSIFASPAATGAGIRVLDGATKPLHVLSLLGTWHARGKALMIFLLSAQNFVYGLTVLATRPQGSQTARGSRAGHTISQSQRERERREIT